MKLRQTIKKSLARADNNTIAATAQIVNQSKRSRRRSVTAVDGDKTVAAMLAKKYVLIEPFFGVMRT